METVQPRRASSKERREEYCLWRRFHPSGKAFPCMMPRGVPNLADRSRPDGGGRYLLEKDLIFSRKMPVIVIKNEKGDR